MTESKRLYRARDDRMLAGVCGGLAKYLGVDATIVRVLWVVLSIVPGSLVGGLIVYLALALIMPEEPAVSSAPAGGAATGEPEARPPVE